jgi:hypothetical protein
MSPRRLRRLALVLALATVAAATLAVTALAGSLPTGAEWRLEQPAPPPPQVGVEESLGLPVGLGKIGDIEFYAPDRGALITAGNGSTVKPGVWVYNGAAWDPLTAQTPEEGICGASEGRIAWAGPDEFWTVSNGRPGQAPDSEGNLPPLANNTLCHFAMNPTTKQFEIVKSYASLAFESTSYQVMRAAACASPTNCWFAGSTLPAPAVGSFQLHWNGSTVSAEPYLPEGHQVDAMQAFEGGIFESVRLGENDLRIRHALEIPVLHLLTESGAGEPISELAEKLYGPRENLFALDYLRLGANDDALWAAAGPEAEPPSSGEPAGVTVLRYSRLQYSPETGEPEEEATPSWRQVIGPDTKPTGVERFPEEVVNSIAAEPGSSDLWIALESREEALEQASGHPSPTAQATLALISADGELVDELQLPAAKGAAAHVVCPAAHDCWVATTAGWLFHLATSEERANPQPNGDPAFSGNYFVSFRPADEGVPLQTSTALPVDDSGLSESKSGLEGVRVEPVAEEQFARVSLPLLTDEHTRLRNRTELVFSFHLAVKARVRLIAKRRKSVVASTSIKTLKAGKRSLVLRLNINHWPTNLDLQTHALAPLPTASTRENNAATNTVSYGLSFPRTRTLARSWLLGLGLLP